MNRMVLNIQPKRKAGWITTLKGKKQKTENVINAIAEKFNCGIIEAMEICELLKIQGVDANKRFGEKAK
jgi:hypothetical protein